MGFQGVFHPGLHAGSDAYQGLSKGRVMKKEIVITVNLLLWLLGSLRRPGSPPIFAAQSSERKPPKKEKFGSSLKRLKWDPNKQAAVEMEQDNQKISREIGPGDAIKVETNLVVLDLFVTEQPKLRALT